MSPRRSGDDPVGRCARALAQLGLRRRVGRQLKFALDERERRSNGLRLVPLLVRNYRLEGTRMEGLALVSPIPLAAHQHADDVRMRLAEEVARILGTTLSARPDASGDAAPTSEPRVMLPFPAALPNIPSLAPVSPLAALFPAEALSETPPPVTAAVEEVQPSGEPARIAISTPLPLPGASTAVADAREPSDVTSPIRPGGCPSARGPGLGGRRRRATAFRTDHRRACCSSALPSWGL